MAIAIVIISFLALIILHELGHFLFAKRFNVKVEEFGIGLPPRLVGKKVGETLYSLNLLPLGAFVRLEGEEKAHASPRSFSSKSLWQRAVIVGAGVAAFWIVSALIFTILGASSGIPMGVGDEARQGITNPQVRIVGVGKDSPASMAGIELGDTVLEMQGPEGRSLTPTTVKEIQEFTEGLQGKEVVLLVQRGGETKEARLVPREDPPPGQGAMGVALVRSALVRYAWYEAPIQGIIQTVQLTGEIVKGLAGLVGNLVQGKGVPQGVELMGPVGILHLLGNSLSLGIPHFLAFFAVLSLYLAIFNALPIPAVDGGKLLFLGIEALRRKPVPERVEGTISTVVFALLITLMIWVTINDITRIF